MNISNLKLRNVTWPNVEHRASWNDHETSSTNVECNICAAWMTKCNCCFLFLFSSFFSIISLASDHLVFPIALSVLYRENGAMRYLGAWNRHRARLLWLGTNNNRRMNKWHEIFFIGFTTPPSFRLWNWNRRKTNQPYCIGNLISSCSMN